VVIKVRKSDGEMLSAWLMALESELLLLLVLDPTELVDDMRFL
jgi:hypothetical protein